MYIIIKNRKEYNIRNTILTYTFSNVFKTNVKCI